MISLQVVDPQEDEEPGGSDSYRKARVEQHQK